MALFDLDKAISLKPDHAMAYYTRGDAHTKIGQDIEAQADYDKACALDSQFCK
jgi:Tfp pilus assembly protein PilF